jgi:hypothetical protein
VAAQCEARNVFARSNTGIVGSNPIRGMDVCPRYLEGNISLYPLDRRLGGLRCPSGEHTDLLPHAGNQAPIPWSSTR